MMCSILDATTASEECLLGRRILGTYARPAGAAAVIRHLSAAAILLLLLGTRTSGASSFPPSCLAAADDPASVQVAYGGRTFSLTSVECRKEFLTDPERYAQLYDALRELQQKGKAAPAPRSLVPS